MPKVFVSYSHDSDNHKERVLALANKLRAEGVDCSIDRYESFPPDGWPQWMATQIRNADYVLVVCTEIYKRRATGEEKSMHGLGAAWECLLITQKIYDEKGRNSKFIPIVFDENDVPNVPEFLMPATRFHVGKEEGYETLYRLLTQQPAVVKPPLGPLKKISTIEEKTTSQTESSDLIDDSKAFVELLGPTVIWRLPRGFVLLDDLEKEPGPSWATVASYYDYGGKWVHSTHYHESYRWDEKRNAINDQCAKLGVPRGDWFLARPLIDFMMQVREGKVTISSDGKVTGAYVFDPLCVTVHPPGKVNLPKRPAQYRRLAASGRIRDLAVEADDFVTRAENRGMRPEPWETNFDEKVKRLRREVRVEVHRILSEKHPAVKNLEEIILQYSSEPDSYLSWLREFRSATWEAARCVEDQTS